MDFRNLLWNLGGSHDKVWGTFRTEDGLVTFWGRRGASYTFKHAGTYSSADIYDLEYKKKRSGYRPITIDELTAACQRDGKGDFASDLHRQYIKKKLRGDFHGEAAPVPIDIGQVF
jgi:hypothetical protein